MVDDASVVTPDVDGVAEARPADPGSAGPDLSKTVSAIEGVRGRSVSLTVLALLAVLYTLYFARDFLLPIVFALLLSFLLSPLVRALVRFHIPAPLGAGLVVLAILGVLGS